ncbi:VWA domain-containing protein [Constantimarinum furrinae]|uniref:VWA domain-containing protein n=1 Tax=Constantimarinum furrinae TaxID=2562285 RepID=A0A7G8PWH5_9FLAO|nr:VWA domain-containing protein [Constantimarinum furrinae]QNJ98691.1 hypothetical protein ALE3EI_2146 [Constantimarinum furrinae]
MTAETILYIVIAIVISLGVTVFMYGYKSKHSNGLRWTFGILRFITIFSILLLLINPKFRSETYTIEKPKLPVIIDNSASVRELGQDENVQQLIERLMSNSALSDKFDISYYSFGSGFAENDSLSFNERNTKISEALRSVDEIFDSEIAPTILITDGNQTLGTDYQFSVSTFRNPVFPVILGDSTTYTDLKIEQLNTNRYAFLKNQFPVEVILVYSGNGTATSQFSISQGAATLFRETISFSETENTKTLSFTLPATAVGLQKYTAQIAPLEDEKNTVNNFKLFAVEVIDQATNVLVVSDMIHPDLGSLGKSISSNEQRTVSFKKPSEAIPLLNDHQLIVLYQPDRSFSSVFSEIEKLKKNVMFITGLQTDWNFLNSVQENFNKEVSGQTEDVTARINLNYGTFAIEDIGFNDLPPLQTRFGGLNVTVPHEIILEQEINGFSSESPMMATMEIDNRRFAILDGEGLWKWRAQSFLLTEGFQEFDNFIGKTVQYLASNKRRSRLEVSSETFYYNNNPIRISAQYFDKNFVFDPRASLTISVVNTETEARTVFPLLLKNNYYDVDLNTLPAGEYRYTISVQDEAVARSGNFTILDFNVEQQFLNADVTKLQSIATNTGGSSYFITETDDLIADLLANDQFTAVQKSEQKTVPLIDWKYLLALIVLSLASEWFIRKYNGLI